MTLKNSPPFDFELYDRPGRHWTASQRTMFVNELRALASQCLYPLPDYQCLSSATGALDDKLIVIARRPSDSEIVAFVSSVFLPMPAAAGYASPFTVFHTGLTCISPKIRRTGMTIELFARIFFYMTSRHPEGFWLTSLAEVPSSLVSISHYATNVFPSPYITEPTSMHLHIAETISRQYRDVLLISPAAVFDADRFVFEGSNDLGSCFRKDRDDKQLHHRRTDVNEYYRDLLGKGEGDEVLQVGYVTRERIVQANNEEARLQRSVTPLKAKL
ncbi:unnamed protein product [Somion occarium]|uniref:N-acetyltransferase domain-containing protein n=1 Tax=Somion occarium TaxID=3059160 RepID=A0ABP1EAC1_9APHY